MATSVIDGRLRLEVAVARLLPTVLAVVVGVRREEGPVPRGPGAVLARAELLATTRLAVRAPVAGHLHAALVVAGVVQEGLTLDVAGQGPVAPSLRHPLGVPAVASMVAKGRPVAATIASTGPATASRLVPAAAALAAPSPEVGREGREVVVLPRRAIVVPRGPQEDAVTVAVRVEVAREPVALPAIQEGGPLGGLEGASKVPDVDVGPFPVP